MAHLSRRTFVKGIAAASAATLAAPGAAHAARLSFGPASFDVTSNSALVWLRPDGRTWVQVEYSTRSDFSGASLTASVTATPDTDYAVATELTGLAPDTEYFYRGVLSDGGDPVRGAPGRFRTAPETAKEFRFAWSGDMEAGHQPFRLLESVARQQPAFFLHLGDTIYADHPKDRFVATLSAYRSKHRENRDDRFLQRMLAAMPVAAIWDDHEVQNDFNRTHPALPLGRQAFLEYWPMRTADPTVLYRRFAWTPAAEFFVLDCRSHRSPQSDSDGPAKTMLGKEQKAWLKERLAASKATFKFLVSSVPFLVPAGGDVWHTYPTERRELRAFFEAESIRNVIILSADWHMALDIEQADGLNEFLAGPIAAWPQCQMNRGAKERLERSGRFFICDGPNYGLVKVRPDASPPEAEVEIIDAKSTVRHRRTITAAA
ncbi:MAG: alkaline phosphatase D family protein [Candidatus Rokuibacteriota bacterium]